MVGGEPTVVAEARPVLECVGSGIFYPGVSMAIPRRLIECSRLWTLKE